MLMSYMYPFRRYAPDFPKIVSGSGIYLIDEDGKRYIDTSSGPMTTSLGHCHPDIVRAMKTQLDKLHFAYRHHFRCNEPEELARTLVELSDDNKAFAFFLNGGSEASEAAYRIVLEFFARTGFNKKRLAIGRRITNHGNTVQSLIYGDDHDRKKGLLDRVIDRKTSDLKLPPCYCFQCPFNKSPDLCHLECVDESMKIIDGIGDENIACVFLEPVPASSGGALVPHARYMKRMKEELAQRNILLIADEIVTCLGRTGRWFNMEYWGADADITVIGKSLGAGFTPISGLLVSKRIGEELGDSTLPHVVGHTYSGNPLSTSVALSVIKVIKEQIGLEEINNKGRLMKSIFEEEFLAPGLAVDVRGQGLLWAMETKINRNEADKFIRIGHRLGVNLYPCRSSGADGSALTFLFAPPFTITRSELREMASIVKEVFHVAAGSVENVLE